jgi:hypothetical protein
MLAISYLETPTWELLMVLSHAVRFAAVPIIAAGLVYAPSATALADNPPPSQVLSNFENYFAANIVRDCGYSQPLPADPSSSLWLFCDTDVYGFNSQGQWGLSQIISGSTAAEGPATSGEVPTGLSELTSPGTGLPALPNHDGPAQFLPTPSGLETASGQPCDSANGAYAASWLSGVTQDPAQSSDVLVSFNDFCVPTGGGTPLHEGFGLAEYDPGSNTLDSQTTVFWSPTAPLPPQQLLGSPTVSGSYLYLFGAHCADTYDATCIANSGNAVYLARVSANPAAWSGAGDYQWYAGPGTWTASAGSATSVISGATPLAVNVGNFSALGQHLVLIEQTNDVGGFTVYEARSPGGTWQEKTSGTVPCTTEGDSFCRAIIGHPELSTTGDLLVSYFNPGAAPYYYPGAGPEGHVMVAAFPW